MSRKITFDLSDSSRWIPVYIPLLYSKKNAKFVYGSRNSAKSHATAEYLMYRLLSEPTRAVFVRKVGESIKDSQWQTLKDVVESYGPQVSQFFKFTVSPLKVTVPHNGNFVIARGLDKPDKAKSVRDPNFIWFEELDQIEYEAFRDTRLSIRGHGRKEFISTFNAPPEDHWIVQKTLNDYEDWERPDGMHTYVRKEDPNNLILHTNYLMNPYADTEFKTYVNELKDFDFEEYRVQGLGMIGSTRTGEEFFGNFDQNTHVKDNEPNDNLAYHLTFDFNERPYSTCLVLQIMGNKFVQVDEICLAPADNTIEDIAEVFYKRFPNCREVFVYGDPTGKSGGQRKSRNERRSYTDQIRHEFSRSWHNKSDRFIRKAPALSGRRAAWRDILTGRSGVKYEIHSRCNRTTTDFKKLKIANEGGYVKEKDKDRNGFTYEKYGHCADALTYFFAFHLKSLF